MKLRNASPEAGRNRFPAEAYADFDIVSNDDLAKWQDKVKADYKLDEGEWELIDGAEAG